MNNQRKLIAAMSLCLTAAVPGLSFGALIDRGGGLIYDTVLNVTWLQDANYGFGSVYDSMDGTTDGRMRWWNAVPWAANLSYYDSVRDVTYDDWRLPTTGPVDGVTLNYSVSYNGSTDSAMNVSAPGTPYAGSIASEMAHLFYNSLNNKGYCDPIASSSNNSNCVVQSGYGLLNTGPFINFQGGAYWSGTQPPEAWGTDAAWFFVFGSDSQAGLWDSDIGRQTIFSRDARIHVLAVRDGDVYAASAIPVPAAAWLFGSGLIGLIGVARRKAA